MCLELETLWILLIMLQCFLQRLNGGKAVSSVFFVNTDQKINKCIDCTTSLEPVALIYQRFLFSFVLFCLFIKSALLKPENFAKHQPQHTWYAITKPCAHCCQSILLILFKTVKLMIKISHFCSLLHVSAKLLYAMFWPGYDALSKSSLWADDFSKSEPVVCPRIWLYMLL